MDVLVDTSAWVEALRSDGDPRVRETVAQITREGRPVLCDLVRLELWKGARGQKEKEMLTRQ